MHLSLVSISSFSHYPILTQGMAVLLGATGTLGFAPTFLWPLLIFSLAGIWFLLDQAIEKKASLPKIFSLGWLFGLGHFTAGLYWITHALTLDLASFWWLIPFALVGLPAVLAIFTGTSFVLTALWPYGGISRTLAFSALWVAIEWGRGHLFTGFPWNLVGYTWGFSDAMSQLSSLGGIYSLSLLTLLMAVFWEWLWKPPSLRRKIIFACIYLAAGLVWLWGNMRLPEGTESRSPTFAIRLVQPNIPQTLKWDPRQREENFNKLLNLTAAPSSLPLRAIIWPESAVSFFIEENPYAQMRIATAIPKGALLFTGGLRRNADNVWNSLLVLNDKGALVAHYDKSHLVPFGEYLPLRSVFDFMFGKGTVKKITSGGIDFKAGGGPQSLCLPDGVPSFSGLVCYEVIFPSAILHPTHPRPEWIVNVTNDAWYGTSSGPYQHLESAHFRAIETGIPVVRAANSGVSAVFDGYGRRIESLPLNETGILDVLLPLPTLIPPPYARWGDSIPWALILALFIIGWAIRKFDFS